MWKRCRWNFLLELHALTSEVEPWRTECMYWWRQVTQTFNAFSMGRWSRLYVHSGMGQVTSIQLEISRKCQGRTGGVTPIDSIVTAATALVNLYTKEGVESLRILPYTSINVRVVNGWNSTQSMVKAPKISVVNGQNAEKSWSKFWPCGRSCDCRVYGSDIPLYMVNGITPLAEGVLLMAWVVVHRLCGGHILSNQSLITVVSAVLFWYL